jgi:hypothetical protein
MIKILTASVLAIGLASSAFAQSNPSPAGASNTTHTDSGASMKMKKVDKMKTDSTTRNFNQENCKSKRGKGSLQTQGGNSNTENTENTCADNNN